MYGYPHLVVAGSAQLLYAGKDVLLIGMRNGQPVVVILPSGYLHLSKKNLENHASLSVKSSIVASR